MYRKTIFVILFLTSLTINIVVVSAAVTANWGDVIDVKYSLWYDAAHTQEAPGNIDITLTYIYLSYASTIPSEVTQLYPEANTNYLQAFEEAIIGMEVNEEKDFVITKENQPAGYSQYDLYYHIKLLKIWYDASISTTTIPRTIGPSPFQDFDAVFVIFAGILVITAGFIIWNLRSSRRMRSIISEDQLGSSIGEQAIKKDRDALKELLELTESRTTENESALDKSDIKFRRRRN